MCKTIPNQNCYFYSYGHCNHSVAKEALPENGWNVGVRCDSHKNIISLNIPDTIEQSRD